MKKLPYEVWFGYLPSVVISKNVVLKCCEKSGSKNVDFANSCFIFD